MGTSSLPILTLGLCPKPGATSWRNPTSVVTSVSASMPRLRFGAGSMSAIEN
jgi:hypothetical protein